MVLHHSGGKDRGHFLSTSKLNHVLAVITYVRAKRWEGLALSWITAETFGRDRPRSFYGLVSDTSCSLHMLLHHHLYELIRETQLLAQSIRSANGPDCREDTNNVSEIMWTFVRFSPKSVQPFAFKTLNPSDFHPW